MITIRGGGVGVCSIVEAFTTKTHSLPLSSRFIRLKCSTKDIKSSIFDQNVPDNVHYSHHYLGKPQNSKFLNDFK